MPHNKTNVLLVTLRGHQTALQRDVAGMEEFLGLTVKSAVVEVTLNGARHRLGR
jgi:hypothetical protein